MDTRITDQQIIELYELFDTQFISKLGGVSIRYVRDTLKKHGIKIRIGGCGTTKFKTGLSKISGKYGLSDISFSKVVALLLLGGKCVKCGCSDYRVLQFNHINGERAKEKSYKFYADICLGKPVPHLEVRCANCNLIHEFERGKRSNLIKLVDEKTGQLTSLFYTAKQQLDKVNHYLRIAELTQDEPG
jgi:hypothetical protein